ncbi:MAG: response regulator [Kiritimatiellia bacterium]
MIPGHDETQRVPVCKPLILLVDDEEHLLITVSDLLEYSGYSVSLARSAEEALGKLAEIRPDLIILDISMPGMGGLGFINELRRSRSDFDGKVLVLTARANLRAFLESAPGVDGFLAKPCRKEILLETIESLLARVDLERTRTRRDRKRLVLLGEDDSLLSEGIRSSFERGGFRIEIANSGSEVLRLAPTLKPEVIVLDQALHDMSGDIIVTVLKTIPTTNSIPVVVYDPALSEVAPDARRKPAGTFDRYLRTSSGDMLVAAVQDLLAS